MFFEDKYHVYQLYVDDPLRVEARENLTFQDANNQPTGTITNIRMNTFSYPGGRVGFRCASPSEHAHFRKLKVKPVL